MRAELMALYAEADALVEGWSCACSPGGLGPGVVDCCHFGQIGREPYPTPVELEEVREAMRRSASDVVTALGRRLPLADRRRCPLLSVEGRCRIYASRPLGCRTYFCQGASSPGAGAGARDRWPRAALQSIGQRVADLSARFAPRDPHPRPLVRALAADGRGVQNR